MYDPTDEQMPRTIRGRFWFIEHSSVVLNGELIVSPPHDYDVHLVLPHYALSAPGYWESLMGKNISVLLGVDERGRPLTLIGCTLYRSSASYRAPHDVSWHELHISVQRCLLGAHITQPINARIHAFSAFFTGFNQWAAAYDYELFPQDPTAELPFIKRSDSVEGFGEIKICRAGGASSTISDVGTSKTLRYWRPRFEPAEPVSIDAMLDAIRAFQQLLCLLQGRPVGFNDLRAEIVRDDKPERDQHVREAEIMVMMPGYKNAFDQYKKVEPLVPLREIADCWVAVVTKWFITQPQYAAALNLYFATVLAADLYDEQKVLFLAHALEGYHRCTFRTERTFLQRITELTNPVSGLLSYFVSDQSAFLENVRDVRNELSHPGSGRIDLGVINAHAMWRQLKAVFEICFLSDLGVSATALERIGRECAEWIPASEASRTAGSAS